MSIAPLIICEFCDSVYRRGLLPDGAAARCRCCGTVLYRNSPANIDLRLALIITALVVFAVANSYPLMKLGVAGRYSEATLLQMIGLTYDSNVMPIALVVAAAVFLFPLLQMCLYAYVLLPLRRGRVPVAFAGAMHALRQMQPWTMVEVFLLGMLVAVVKLGAMASATPEIGMWCFALLTFLLTLLSSQDLEPLWERAEEIERGGRDPVPPRAVAAPAATAAMVSRVDLPQRGRELGLLGCPACGLVLRSHAVDGADGRRFCPRCDQPLHRRKPDAQARCWALLIAAAILYIPANLLPVMRTTQLFDTEDNTILSGVVELWNAGAWDLALIVFTASIAVPLIKIASLGLLLISTGRGSTSGLRERTRIYRMVEFIGRWSMLDVFVVALLLSLVRFGALADVQAGPGIIAFCTVVILTMLASMSFDPRAIWDPAASTHKTDNP